MVSIGGKEARTSGMTVEAVVSFMSDEVVGGEEVASPLSMMTLPTVNYCRFTQLDVNHLLRGRQWLLVFEV